ncbi:MAG: TonB-dependent receptor [Cytophagales bacterium]|nr:TonB-dependent receptor [Cytophagales bacterium]
MRIAFYGLFYFISFRGISQDNYIKPQAKESRENLHAVLTRLEDEYGYKFAYDHKLAKEIFIETDVHTYNIQDYLEQTLMVAGFNFQIIDGIYMIHKKKSHDSFSGIVKDSEYGETLPNALVSLNNQVTITNTDGWFTFDNVPVDSSWLSVQHIGYKEKSVFVGSIKSDSILEIGLETKTEILNGVTVFDSHQPYFKINKQAGHASIDPNKLDNLSNLGENDIMRNLQMLPGILSTDETSSGLLVRASPSSQNLIRLDGFAIYQQDHIYGTLSSLNANAIKDIQIHKGAFDARLGGRASSIIDIFGKSGNKTRPSGTFSINMLNANLAASAPVFKTGSVFFAVRRSYTDVMQTPLFKKIINNVSGFHPINESVELGGNSETGVILVSTHYGNDVNSTSPVYHFSDVYSKLNLLSTEKDIVSFSFYHGKDQKKANYTIAQIDGYEIAYVEKQTTKDQWGNSGTGVRWGRYWNKKFFSNTVIGVSRLFKDYSNSFSVQQSVQTDLIESVNSNDLLSSFSIDDLNAYSAYNAYNVENSGKYGLVDFSIQYDNEVKMNNKNSLEFGAFNSVYKIDSTNLIEGYKSSNALVSGIYVQHTFHPMLRWKIVYGLRNSYYDRTGKFYPEPRLSVSYDIFEDLTVKGALGKYHQFLNYVEPLDRNPSDGYWILAEKNNVPTVNSEQFSIGLTYQKNNYTIDVEVYKKNTSGSIFSLPYNLVDVEGDNSLNLRTLRNFYHMASGETAGVDVLIKSTGKKHTGWISYSLSKSNSIFDGINNGKELKSPFDQRHEINIFNAIKMGHWETSSTWVFGSGLPYYKPLVLDDQTTGELISSKLAPMHRLDISFLYHFKIGRSKSKIGLSFINVYNQKNVKRKQVFPSFDPDTGKLGFDFIDIEAMGFATSIKWQIDF